MNYTTNDYTSLLGIEGFSDALLNNHFTLYSGYVTNTNKQLDLLAQLEVDEKTASPEYAEVKRRFGWEWNGMRLHELYFDNMSKAESVFGGKIADLLLSQYGSFEAWEKAFRATGTMRGIGWVVLYYDEVANTTFNQWIGEHDVAHLAGLKPLLVMDVFEHAFMLDYGLKRADYINAFVTHIDWDVVNNRL